MPGGKPLITHGCEVGSHLMVRSAVWPLGKIIRMLCPTYKSNAGGSGRYSVPVAVTVAMICVVAAQQHDKI